MNRHFRLPVLFQLFLLCCALSVTGCRNKQNDHPQETPAATSAKAAAPIAEATTMRPLPYQLKIIPEVPAVNDCIVVSVASGSETLIYRWEINGKIKLNESEAHLCDQQFKRGDLVTVTVSGESGQSQQSVRIGNTPPEIIRTTWKIEGGNYLIVPEARDLDGDDISFSYQWVINGNEISGIDSASLPANRFLQGDEIEVVVTPSDLESQGKVYRSKAASVGNTPPVILSTAPETITGNEYRYDVQAKDPNNDEIRYSLENAPAGMVINEKTGEIRWPLPVGVAGRHKVRIVVQDALGAMATQTFSLDLKQQ